MVRLLYFAALAERLGRTSEEVSLPAPVGDVRALLAWLRIRGGPWAQWLGDDAVRVTVDRQFATLDTPVRDGGEIAILSTVLR